MKRRGDRSRGMEPTQQTVSGNFFHVFEINHLTSLLKKRGAYSRTRWRSALEQEREKRREKATKARDTSMLNSIYWRMLNKILSNFAIGKLLADLFTNVSSSV